VTILLFESNQNQRLLYEMELVDAGYEVLVVGNENEAVTLVLNAQPDLALIGLHLDDDGDVAVLKVLAGFDVPVIVLSASPPDSLLKSFAHAWVLKQSDLGPLLGQIREVGKLSVA